MVTFADLKAAAKRPELSVTLCLRGDLFGERERLRKDLSSARGSSSGDSLAGNPAIVTITARLVELDALMREASFQFTFRALPRSEFLMLEDTHPQKDEAGSRAFFTAMVVASLIDPVLSAGEYTQLCADLSNGQVDVLESAAWSVNREVIDLPFSPVG